MLGRDHALMGAAGTLAVVPALGRLVGSHLGPAETAVAGVVGAGFALLPDLDEPGSTVARKFGLVSEAASHVVHAAAGGHRQATHSLLFAAVVTAGLWGLDRRFVWAAPVELAACLVVAGRFVLPLGAGKGALGALVLPVAAGWWAWRAETGTWDLRAHIDGPHAWAWLALAAGAGVCLHMAGDVLTAGGVPLLWPLRWRVAVPLLGHTSSLRESFAGALLAVGVLLLTWVQVVGPARGHGGPVP
jgi:membrane-bound metal-dependent hydrolase YbcI (DUF457 family)